MSDLANDRLHVIQVSVLTNAAKHVLKSKRENTANWADLVCSLRNVLHYQSSYNAAYNDRIRFARGCADVIIENGRAGTSLEFLETLVEWLANEGEKTTGDQNLMRFQKDEYLQRITKRLHSNALTSNQIAEIIGVSKQYARLLLVQHPDLFEADAPTGVRGHQPKWRNKDASTGDVPEL